MCASTSKPCARCGPRRSRVRRRVREVRAVSWAWPKPVQAHIPVLVGAAGTEKNFKWIAERRRLDHHAARLRHRRAGEAAAGHLGGRRPRRRAADRGAGLQARPRKLARWAELGVTEVLFGLPDRPTTRSPPTSNGSPASWPRWSEPGEVVDERLGGRVDTPVVTGGHQVEQQAASDRESKPYQCPVGGTPGPCPPRRARFDGAGQHACEGLLPLRPAGVALEEQSLERTELRPANVGPMAAKPSAGSVGASGSTAIWRRSTSSTMASRSSSRDPKWCNSIRWLVPTASATSRRERSPMPPSAKASMSASSSCRRARRQVVEPRSCSLRALRPWASSSR